MRRWLHGFHYKRAGDGKDGAEFRPEFSQVNLRCKLLNFMPIHGQTGATGTQVINKLILCKFFPTLLASVATAVLISMYFMRLQVFRDVRQWHHTCNKSCSSLPSHPSGLKCASGESIEAFALSGQET